MNARISLAATVAVFSAVAVWADEPADTTQALYGNLDELVITAKKDIVKSDGSQITYDLDQDDSSKGQTLLDALRKVPMITVDGQDNIYIKGSRNFKIYLNGKEEPMLTANYQQVFKAMPAEAVSKIEVITEPGAKYDAEGTGGILNLVTERKQTKDGYTANISLTGSAQQNSASVYGRMKQDKVTADAGIDFANNFLQKQHSKVFSETIDTASDANYRQTSEMDQRIFFNYVGARLNLSWEPTDNDLLSYGMEMSSVDAKAEAICTTNKMFNRVGDLLWQTLQQGHGNVGYLNASGNISYRRELDDKGQSLTTAYRFSFGKDKLDLNYENRTVIGSMATIPYEQTGNTDIDREHTATIDYENSFADGKHKLELGAKGVFRRNSACTNHSYGQTADVMTPVPTAGGIDQMQDVYAAYAGYHGTFGNLSADGGVRYEHTYMGLDFADASMQDFRRHLNDVTPNVAVTYMFGPAENLRLSYNMRISRPSASQMNPAVMQITQTNAHIGNPDLRSEHDNNLSLSYSNFTPKAGGSLSLSYSQTNNCISEYNFFKDNINFETYANLGRNCRTELSAFLNWNINNRMSVSANGAVNYTDLKARKEGLHNSGWKGNYGVNYNYTGPWNVKYTAYGGQSLGNVNLQGSDSGWYYYGLSIRKSFLKEDALSIILNANNFLTKYTYYKSTTYSGSHIMKLTAANRSWNVGLTISWKFGSLRDEVKTTNANLDNDDTKKTDKGTGIGL